MKNIAILASGSGSNAQAIMTYFKNSTIARVSLVISNNAGAKVLERAHDFKIKEVVINSKETNQGHLLKTLMDYKIDFVVLAGYMKLIPVAVIERFKGRILNIHPALLPKFGGKGMYGMHVHEAVVEAKELETGMTIHFVTAEYDEGQIIFQDKVDVLKSDTPEEVQQKVLKLEHQHYPIIIEQVIAAYK